MAEVISFPSPRKKRKASAGQTLCKSGFHKWQIDQRKQFDVKKGRLVTVRRCARCGSTRTSLD